MPKLQKHDQVDKFHPIWSHCLWTKTVESKTSEEHIQIFAEELFKTYFCYKMAAIIARLTREKRERDLRLSKEIQAQILATFYCCNITTCVQSWSIGYGRRLLFKRLWVQIPTPDTGWFFSHLFVVFIVSLRLKLNKKRPGMGLLKTNCAQNHSKKINPKWVYTRWLVHHLSNLFIVIEFKLIYYLMPQITARDSSEIWALISFISKSFVMLSQDLQE